MRSGLQALLRRGVARVTALAAGGAPGEGLRILTYHRVNPSHPHDRLTVHPEDFVGQLEEIARSGRRVVTLEEGLSALRSDGHAECVVLTFDDGFEDNFSVARPCLERFGFRATFFLSTALVGSGSTLDRYRSCCDGDDMMTWAQARELQARGHTLGGHGRRHVELAPLAAEALREEVQGSARDLERELGEPPRVFCYPRGVENAGVRRAVAEAGYEAACTVRPGGNGLTQDPLALRRTEVAGGDRAADLRLKLAGGFDAWHRLVQRTHRRSPA